MNGSGECKDSVSSNVLYTSYTCIIILYTCIIILYTCIIIFCTLYTLFYKMQL